VALRIYISGGQGFGLTRVKQQPNKIIYASEDIYRINDVNQGIKVKTSSIVNPARSSGIKSNNYLPEIIALENAKKEEFDDVLSYNQQGELTECLSSNVFFLSRQGDQYSFDTPALQSGLFAGIMRNNIIKMFHLATIPYQERVIYREEIPRFDEAFTCSTLRGLMPIVMIDRHRLQTLRKNAAFWHVKRLFDSVVENKIGFRVNWQTGEKTHKDEVSEKPKKSLN
nr:aminotransferase class IV [Oligoflexales bacterium]